MSLEEELDFSTMILWAQAHGLSMELLSMENARKIGDMVGRVIELDKACNRLFSLEEVPQNESGTPYY
ncbi:hypothetical protein PanWU01x14_270020 [Parasponia andersonii]|uniref:Uncharacterized protein n=1 Tax=Parasponia andersonii TaxID=3476 RepID=A0A2P5B5K9_PARAD|nr:hypothetical protein PanWU01x14_270020 [Parasponia andersonii]